MARVRRAKAPAEARPWGTGKLAALLAGAAALVAAIAVGMGLAVYFAVTGDPQGGPAATQPTATAGTGAAPGAGPAYSGGAYGYDSAAADDLADRPMPNVPFEASQPGPISTEPAAVLDIPTPTRTGPAGVPTGFPQTAEGALAQLTAIGQTAMQTGSIQGVRTVISQWALPGGPTPGGWSGTQAMADLLSSAGLPADGTGRMMLSVTPIMGLIKGVVGDTFVVPCVDYEFAATVQSTARAGVADCQRMVWADSRWMVGPGPEPATPPSVWPGTDLAAQVGYRGLRYV